jgi:hypothetical protein
MAILFSFPIDPRLLQLCLLISILGALGAIACAGLFLLWNTSKLVVSSKALATGRLQLAHMVPTSWRHWRDANQLDRVKRHPPASGATMSLLQQSNCPTVQLADREKTIEDLRTNQVRVFWAVVVILGSIGYIKFWPELVEHLQSRGWLIP